MRKFLLLSALACASLAQAQQQTYVLGGPAHSWESGGGGRDPERLIGRFSAARVETTNTPGNAIEFAHKRGWISPRFFAEETNIAPLVLERGSISAPNLLSMNSSLLRHQLEGMVNGDHEVAFERKPTPFNPEVATWGIWIALDFGQLVGVHRLRFYPRNTVVPTPAAPFQDDFLRSFEVWVNDRQTNAAQGAQDVLITRVTDNQEPVAEVETAPQYVRLVKLRSLSEVPFEIDEIEVYGTGYLDEATYFSDLIDLGGKATVGRVSWEENVIGEAPFSVVAVKARTGSDDTLILYRKNIFGIGRSGRRELLGFQEVSGEEYWGLEQSNRAVLEEDSQNWSPWQAVENGRLFTAPGPRRYIQFQFQFQGRLFDTRQIGTLRFDYLQPPIADTLRAEIFPRLAQADQPVTFRYAVQLRAMDAILGYDRLEIDTQALARNIRALQIDGQSIAFSVESITPNAFRLAFPLIKKDQAILEFKFDLPIFRYGTTFSGRAYNSQFPAVPQRLEPGQVVHFGPADVDELSGLSVAIPKEQIGSLVGEISLTSRMCTPNGDGVNDQFEVYFTLLQLLRPVPVVLEIYDLAGQQVHRVFAEELSIGPQTRTWDARGDGGTVVPPGTYIWVLRVKAGAFEERHSGVVSVVY